MSRPIVTLVFLIALSASATAQPSKDRPAELKVLDRLSGEWLEEMTIKPNPVMPDGSKQTSVTKRTWTLGDRFLRMDGVWQPEKTEFVNYVTYDPIDKAYRTWYFDSGGGFPQADLRCSPRTLAGRNDVNQPGCSRIFCGMTTLVFDSG